MNSNNISNSNNSCNNKLIYYKNKDLYKPITMKRMMKMMIQTMKIALTMMNKRQITNKLNKIKIILKKKKKKKKKQKKNFQDANIILENVKYKLLVAKNGMAVDFVTMNNLLDLKTNASQKEWIEHKLKLQNVSFVMKYNLLQINV